MSAISRSVMKYCGERRGGSSSNKNVEMLTGNRVAKVEVSIDAPSFVRT